MSRPFLSLPMLEMFFDNCHFLIQNNYFYLCSTSNRNHWKSRPGWTSLISRSIISLICARSARRWDETAGGLTNATKKANAGCSTSSLFFLVSACRSNIQRILIRPSLFKVTCFQRKMMQQKVGRKRRVTF